jgi:hypothetical protein
LTRVGLGSVVVAPAAQARPDVARAVPGRAVLRQHVLHPHQITFQHRRAPQVRVAAPDGTLDPRDLLAGVAPLQNPAVVPALPHGGERLNASRRGEASVVDHGVHLTIVVQVDPGGLDHTHEDAAVLQEVGRVLGVPPVTTGVLTLRCLDQTNVVAIDAGELDVSSVLDQRAVGTVLVPHEALAQPVPLGGVVTGVPAVATKGRVAQEGVLEACAPLQVFADKGVAFPDDPHKRGVISLTRTGGGPSGTRRDGHGHHRGKKQKHDLEDPPTRHWASKLNQFFTNLSTNDLTT